MTATLHCLVVAGIFWSIVCRARHMDSCTPTLMKLQYGALLVGAVASLPIYTTPDVGQLLLGAAVLLYLWIDSKRWRRGVPRLY